MSVASSPRAGEPSWATRLSRVALALVLPLVLAAWTQEAELTASNGGEYDTFGTSVALDDGIAIVGAPVHGNDPDPVGEAYVFVRSGAGWIQQATLKPTDGTGNDQFGAVVAVSGGTAIIGAPGHAVDGYPQVGTAYVFVQNGTHWTQQAELLPSEWSTGDQVASTVAVSGDTAIVGISGTAAYVFVRNGTHWAQQAELAPNEGEGYGDVGAAVAVSGDTAIVGAPQDWPGGPLGGSAVVFVRSGTTWTQQADLTASDGASDDQFGTAVSVSGDAVVVGAPNRDSLTGAAYVFGRSGTTWTQQAELTANDGPGDDFFGASVSMSAGAVVVGALGQTSQGSVSGGAAYLFLQTGTSWVQAQELGASDAGYEDELGTSVSVSGGTVLAGAPYHAHGSVDEAGAAYVFGFCSIDGVAYADGTENPADACQVCASSLSATAWSPANGCVDGGTDAGTGGAASTMSTSTSGGMSGGGSGGSDTSTGGVDGTTGSGAAGGGDGKGIVFGGCGCTTVEGSSPPLGLAVLGALLALSALRRDRATRASRISSAWRRG